MATFPDLNIETVKVFYEYLLTLYKRIESEYDKRYFILLFYEFLVVYCGFIIHDKEKTGKLKNVKLGLSEIKKCIRLSGESDGTISLLKKFSDNVRHNPVSSEYINDFIDYVKNNIRIFIALDKVGFLAFDNRLLNILISIKLNGFGNLLDCAGKLQGLMLKGCTVGEASKWCINYGYTKEMVNRSIYKLVEGYNLSEVLGNRR